MRIRFSTLLAASLTLVGALLPAQETTSTLAPSDKPAALIAVAANFAEPARTLARELEQRTHAHIDFVTGSSGKHYALISNGAPYDAMLSADTERPSKRDFLGREQAGALSRR